MNHNNILPSTSRIEYVHGRRIEYIDVGNMSHKDVETFIAQKRLEIKRLKDPEHYYDFTRPKDRFDTVLEQIQEQEARRRPLRGTKKKPHPTHAITIQGQPVHIDNDMIPVVEWLNSLPGTKTCYCCQGDVNDPDDVDANCNKPYVLWRSNSQLSVKAVLELFQRFHNHSMIDNVKHTYHEIQTEVEYFEDDLRYCSRWFDNLALQDFNQWAGFDKDD